jgi:membrane protease YdiL (CAAX protease family)
VYGALAALAVAFAFFRGNPDIFHHPNGILSRYLPGWARVLIGAATGVGLGLLVARFTTYSVYRYEWAKALHSEFRSLLGPLRSLDIFVFAATSAVAEEIFFRGAVQLEIGIAAASLIFGALHIAPDKRYIPWPIQAATMGFAFGGLYWLIGDLTAPIVLHFTINYQNLHFINRYNPVIKLPRALVSGHGQVGN